MPCKPLLIGLQGIEKGCVLKTPVMLVFNAKKSTKKMCRFHPKLHRILYI